MKTPIDNLIEAAVSWWAGKRPEGWTEAQHLENPTVNATDKELAQAVADAIKYCEDDA